MSAAVGPDFDWDAHWTDYDATAQCNPGQMMRHRMVAGTLAREGSAPAMRLLDLGSGQGDMLAVLRKVLPGAALAGFELSPSGVTISKRKVPEADLVVADLFNPNPAMARFRSWATHAVCCEVLEHVDDPVGFLRCASEYLAPGALLIVTVPGGPMSAFDKYIGHRQHFTTASISGAVESAGFRTVSARKAGFPFFNLYRLTVIARGSKLIDDAKASEGCRPNPLAVAVMGFYWQLFRFNLADSPFGWQNFVLCRKVVG